MKLVHNISALALAASVLAACGGVGTFSSLQNNERSSRSFDYAAGGRDLHTQIIGNPFDGDKAGFDRRVTAILTAHNTRQPTNYTTEPGSSARLQYRVVIVFNETTRVIDFDLCRDPAPVRTGQMAPGKLTVHAVFCNDGVALRSIRGNLGSSTGADEPRFEQFISQTGYLLMAPDNWRARKED